ncbi:origin recognition complex subunit 4 [Modicella reniformis]|uniref:Origin recognition complex subunit 4 n=1 Tax=Modicella reniformis TaxID=1440133 RepID=A0A9P6LYP8_9FUNG|nr:origin recognition complex subunit 4 [Modicella reniformis]
MSTEELVTLAKTAVLARLGERTLPPTLVGLEEQYKKVLVRQALQEIEQQFRIKNLHASDEDMDVDEAQKEFMVIHLNGMIQTDDKMALKEIMRQLSREGESEMDTNASFSDSLPSLLSFLTAGSKDQYPIIFILDKFDLFPQHTKQLLLYNLFDMAQSAE